MHSPFTLDQPLTVTITDDQGIEHTFHGTMYGTRTARTFGQARGIGHLTLPDGSTGDNVRDFLLIRTMTGSTARDGLGFDLGTLARTGWDWEFGMLTLMVCPDSDTVTVTPITAAGLAWVEAHESDRRKIDRLVARFAEFDADAAKRLGDLIEEVLDEARQDAYWDGTRDAYESSSLD